MKVFKHSGAYPVGLQSRLVERNFLEVVFRVVGDINNPSDIAGFEGIIKWA